MSDEELPKKRPCEIFDGHVEDKVAELLANGEEVPSHLMGCYTESKKLKVLKGDSIP